MLCTTNPLHFPLLMNDVTPIPAKSSEKESNFATIFLQDVDTNNTPPRTSADDPELPIYQSCRKSSETKPAAPDRADGDNESTSSLKKILRKSKSLRKSGKKISMKENPDSSPFLHPFQRHSSVDMKGQ